MFTLRQKSKTTRRWFIDSWWPGAESNHRHKDFQTLKIIVFDSRNIAEPSRQSACPIYTETIGFEWNKAGLAGLDRIHMSRLWTLERVDFDQP